jgi:hypothetical protein
VEKEFGNGSLQIGILGCSDGKFVLPAARKGHKVLAIDIDHVAIFGGNKVGPNGNILMPGLISRLNTENLTKYVEVACQDFVEFSPASKQHAVWTSGAINYSFNLKHSISSVIESIKRYVVKKGFIYFDYMMPFEPSHFERVNYFKEGELVKYFNESNWKVIYDIAAKRPQLELAHVDLPTDHYHKWGHLCVQSI